MTNYIRVLNQAEDYIESHLSETITLEDLANNAAISSYHFHRLFKSHSTETVKKFITRIKMERSAIFLVSRDDLSMTEIAFNYGYSEASSFNRAFKKFHGMSPSEYRKARNAKN